MFGERALTASDGFVVVVDVEADAAGVASAGGATVGDVAALSLAIGWGRGDGGGSEGRFCADWRRGLETDIVSMDSWLFTRDDTDDVTEMLPDDADRDDVLCGAE